jgi:cytochrome P450
MRLYGPVTALSKITAKDVELDGYKIPKGTRIMIHSYSIHHDEEIFKNAFEFNPDRFDNEKFPHYSCKI